MCVCVWEWRIVISPSSEHPLLKFLRNICVHGKIAKSTSNEYLFFQFLGNICANEELLHIVFMNMLSFNF